ncbi:enamine deaminase RidA (YjgF/YER057c/UK114 family) [Nakamurella sp. UYEF19]
MSRRHLTSGSTFETQIGYARAVVDGEWVFVSGCTGFEYTSMTLAEGVVAQAEQTMLNVVAALAEAGATVADVVRVHYLLPDRNDFAACWPTLRRYFGDAPPAATMMQCGLLDPAMLIEIEVTALLRRP